jgi:type II secretory pathway pseudopilin PulG
VVIAIITILASIVAPKVAGYIERGKMAKAVSEIRNADLALTKMLADVERKHFGPMLKISPDPRYMSYAAAVQLYTDAFYELLRRGKDSVDDFNGNVNPITVTDPKDGVIYTATLDGKLVKKLGTTYMDINLDPWGKAYQFYAGPLKLKLDQDHQDQYPPFRSFRGEGYMYGTQEKIDLDAELRGNPTADFQPGFPCPVDLPVYIFSWGGNSTPNQPWLAAEDVDLGIGGGDDINNWDTQSGWSGSY